MSRYSKSLANVVLMTWLITLMGCHPQQPFYLFEDGDKSHYIGESTRIELPDVEVESLGEVEGTLPPLSLENPDPSERWELSLETAIQQSLQNSKVIRSLGGVTLGPSGAFGEPSSLLSQPEGIPTIWDPSRTETDPRSGMAAALSGFDPTLTSSLSWEKNDTPANVQTGGVASLFRPTVLEQDLGTFQTRLQKFTAPGGIFSLTHNVRYEQSNLGLRQWPSDWNVNLEAEFRQPLMRGAGVAVNRIQGPGAIPGYNAGVLIARLRHDVSLADFEAAVRNLVRDVEKAYWELYFAYRRLHAAQTGHEAALQTWRKTNAEKLAGGIRDRMGQARGSAQDEAQARLQLFTLMGNAQQAQSNLFKTESHLRWILGLGPSDGRLIRPSDEPTKAKIEFDWYEAHAEALVRSVELRRQKWRVQARRLELISAKNYLLPRVDIVGRYRWLGLGDHLINPSRQSDPFDNAYQSLTSGDHQEWQFGIELSHTLGSRKEKSGVQHAQMNLNRDLAVLKEQELELTHQLNHAFRDLHDTYVFSETNFKRYVAAKDEMMAVNAAYEQGTATLDRVLDAQSRMAAAENDYFRSIVEYNEAISTLHYRKGSLLEYNKINLAEGPWNGKAYFDALRRARARDASIYLDYGFTRPKVFSRGSLEQHPGGSTDGSEVIYESAPLAPLAPTPAPAKIQKAPFDDQSRVQPNGNRQAMRIPPPSRPRSSTQHSSRPHPLATSNTGKRFDLSNLNLHALAGKPSRKESSIQMVGFEKPIVSKQWKNAPRSSTSHVRKEDQTPTPTRWSASDWKSVQR